MDMLTLEQVAAFCGASTRDIPYVEITGVGKDNRMIQKGDLFIAIKGECFDGHDFVKNAAEAGAPAAIVEREIKDAGIPLIIVPDTVKALGDLAREYRKTLDVKVVGITGSVGKTTTKEIVASILSREYYIHKTLGNLNNEIGLPFTVLGLNRSHQAAVIEMGTNHFGEISRLSRIARPDIAVITAIGETHLEFLGSKRGVLKAKLEIKDGIKPNGRLILNGDEPLLWELKGKLGVEHVYFGIKNPECDVFGTVISGDLDNVKFSVRGFKRAFNLPCGGEHNIRNALSAICVAANLGMSEKSIEDGLSGFMNTGMRQRVIDYAGFKVINDCYNASPDSMRAALALLKDRGGRRIAVLGDMLELGAREKSAHYEMGKIAARGCELLFAYGENADNYGNGALENGMDKDFIRLYKDAEALAADLKNIIRLGDTVLVKGSRGARMERIVNKIIEED